MRVAVGPDHGAPSDRPQEALETVLTDLSQAPVREGSRVAALDMAAAKFRRDGAEMAARGLDGARRGAA